MSQRSILAHDGLVLQDLRPGWGRDWRYRRYIGRVGLRLQRNSEQDAQKVHTQMVRPPNLFAKKLPLRIVQVGVLSSYWRFPPSPSTFMVNVLCLNVSYSTNIDSYSLSFETNEIKCFWIAVWAQFNHLGLYLRKNKIIFASNPGL